MTRDRVLALVEFYRPILGLENWDLDIQFTRDKEEDSTASCRASPEYRHAIIRFDLDQIGPDALARTVLHECLHCKVWRLAILADDLAADNPPIAKAVDRAHEEVTTDFEHILHGLIGEPE